MSAKWFANHTAYTIAKYGMSMCVLGMAEEFRTQGVAVNALWPRTTIHTAAVEMLHGSEGALYSRKPEIMADAAYIIFCRDSREYTGNFFVDEKPKNICFKLSKLCFEEWSKVCKKITLLSRNYLKFNPPLELAITIVSYIDKSFIYISMCHVDIEMVP